MKRIFRKPFYAMLQWLIALHFRKGRDYDTIDQAYTLASNLHWQLRRLYTFHFGSEAPISPARVKAVISNANTQRRLEVSKFVSDWRLDSRNPQNKFEDIWSEETLSRYGRF
ncbi:hypothetical protein H6G00_01810 [Leptolyngbya sp. FACHB-541]|uniref:hypothetical protein n=1 Tax=Leptolyngbya sp. FACHB-541 TaxID=2692810 RepID=UPI001689D344|nr:hypothetical protein [Leptolyngbya sp. FACHB-541]MBD1995367.1 hypothetical protein [Leptolyngbya sp. FACHB-541]